MHFNFAPMLTFSRSSSCSITCLPQDPKSSSGPRTHHDLCIWSRSAHLDRHNGFQSSRCATSAVTAERGASVSSYVSRLAQDSLRLSVSHMHLTVSGVLALSGLYKLPSGEALQPQSWPRSGASALGQTPASTLLLWTSQLHQVLPALQRK